MRYALALGLGLAAAACARRGHGDPPPPTRPVVAAVAAPAVAPTLIAQAEAYVAAVDAWTVSPGTEDGELRAADPMVHDQALAAARDVVALARDVAAVTPNDELTAAAAALAAAIDAAPDDALAQVDAQVRRVLGLVRASLDGRVAHGGAGAACVMARVEVGDARRALIAVIDEAAFRSERDRRETGLPDGDPELAAMDDEAAALADALERWRAWLDDPAVADAAAPAVAPLAHLAAMPSDTPAELAPPRAMLTGALARARAACGAR